jgi:hypothetical protein
MIPVNKNRYILYATLQIEPVTMKGKFVKRNELTRKERQKHRDSSLKSTILREKARLYEHEIYTQDLEAKEIEEEYRILNEEAQWNQYKQYCGIILMREERERERLSK